MQAWIQKQTLIICSTDAQSLTAEGRPLSYIVSPNFLPRVSTSHFITSLTRSYIKTACLCQQKIKNKKYGTVNETCSAAQNHLLKVISPNKMRRWRMSLLNLFKDNTWKMTRNVLYFWLRLNVLGMSKEACDAMLGIRCQVCNRVAVGFIVMWVFISFIYFFFSTQHFIHHLEFL